MLRLVLMAMLLGAAAGCAAEVERQWLKPGPYTSDEFKRDAAECMRRGDLDRACMEARGWVTVRASRKSVTPAKAEVPLYRPPDRR